jgi:glycosyltransferase involved in cell wall biosynthesis
VNIIQITPGAGGMYCGGCFRDNALVAALRQQGHSTLMIPLYLPLTLEEEDQSAGTPIFFSGINVYLEQKLPFFRRAPQWLHQFFTAPWLLKLASGSAAKTRAEDLGDLTVSMLRGEEGNQARELDDLLVWLKQQPRPDVICLSNALLIGLVRKLKQELGVPVVCILQGEDSFLDSLPPPDREAAWKTLSERAAEVDLFLAPSRYFADLMSSRLGLPDRQVRLVPNGINVSGYTPATSAPEPPALGFFARMCREKGLDLLVETYIELRRRGRVPQLKLRIGGGCGPSDEAFMNEMRQRLKAHGLLGDTAFFPNLTRAEKLSFYNSLSVFCTPALYGEAFGLYVIEAMAAGVPVVQPRHAAFPEIIEQTGGGVIAEPNAPALASALEELLLDPARARKLGESGRQSVLDKFSMEAMTREMVRVYEELAGRKPPIIPSNQSSDHGL